MFKINFITEKLKKSNGLFFSIYAIVAAFATYTCMYAYRKPFTVATFDNLTAFSIDYKTLIIITQVLGYMLSKFIGIKIISEMKPEKRGAMILLFIGIAQVSLFLFAITPYPYNFIFMFFNGLPLGMVWGLVFSFLEGRRLTELLGAGLSVSFIFSSGFVKSIGKTVMDSFEVSQFYMPFVTGLIFIIPLIIFTVMLEQLPAPSDEDEKLRTKRKPMDADERRNFFTKFAVGISLLTIIYMALTAFRDLRDNFVADIWTELGITDTPMIFTYTEIPVAVIVLVLMGSLFVIRDNVKALFVNHIIILTGLLITGVSTFLYSYGYLDSVIWMILTGLGLYMGYVPFNSMLFDRFIAAFKSEANAGFLIYIADSFGYLASVVVMLYKNFAQPEVSWLKFFINAGITFSIFGVFLTLLSIYYFNNKKEQNVNPGEIRTDGNI